MESPDHPDLYYHRGQVKFIAGQYKPAIDDYKKVLEIDPDFIYAYIQLGVALYKNGDIGESERVFRRATSKFPERSEIMHYHGEVYADQNQLDNGMNQSFLIHSHSYSNLCVVSHYIVELYSFYYALSQFGFSNEMF